MATGAVGAGAACPELLSEEEVCVHCELAWAEWGECSGGLRSRSEYVAVEPLGAGASVCPELATEDEGWLAGVEEVVFSFFVSFSRCLESLEVDFRKQS